MPKKTKRKYDSKQLTEHLRELAARAHDWSEEEGALTKGECLARLLWEKALGYTEVTTTDEGEKKEVFHKPESWAISLVYDRMEGRVPQSIDEGDVRKTKTKDEVRELAMARLNDAAKKTMVEGKDEEKSAE